jgi:putative endonuclease
MINRDVILNVVKDLGSLMKYYFVYILSNDAGTVLYIGVTNNLPRRIYEHRAGFIEGFTKKYKTHKLVYFEDFTDINNAIASEKKVKGWTRAKKIALVESKNPTWKDLFLQLEEYTFTLGIKNRDSSALPQNDKQRGVAKG